MREGFDISIEPWIPARFDDGSVQELSLKDTFARAQDIKDIVGDVPTQVFALTRLLLSILHRALPEITHPVEDWLELWSAPRLPSDLTDDYLTTWSERFDLFHPTTPFFQVADLHTKKGEIAGLEKLIADVPNGAPFFTTRRGSGIESLSFAEAARWLVHAQAYDASGIKSGAEGDDRVKGGKGYPIGTGFAGELGGFLLEGRNLKETLLLNLVLADGSGQPYSRDDIPSWERPPQTSSVEFVAGHAPQGQIEIMTWQSRRIRLFHDGQSVTGVLIANGDALKPQNLHQKEMMTAWRRSKPQEKKLKLSLVYMPRTHNPERSFWRGLSVLFPTAVVEGYRDSLAPGNLRWVHQLLDLRALEGFSLRAHAYGISYGSQSATVSEIIDDAFILKSALLSDQGGQIAARAVNAVAATEQAVDALAHLAGNLAVAAGGDNEGPRDRKREQAYFLLDSEFRRWLSALGADTDLDKAVVDWYDTARSVIATQAKHLVDESGTSEWIGRESKTIGVVNTPKAYAWFRAALRKALPDVENNAVEREEEGA